MTNISSSDTLAAAQQAIVPIAAFAAAEDMPQAQHRAQPGLDAGLTVSEAREVLVQLYAYAGFPRSLSALGELMEMVKVRKQRGVQDAPGRPISKGDALLAAGTANQTRLTGGPVQAPLFDFAPVANEYLRSHLLFGDIYERDNLDWSSLPVRRLHELGSSAFSCLRVFPYWTTLDMAAPRH